MSFLCRRYAVRMDDHCGLLGLTQCYACEKLEVRVAERIADRELEKILPSVDLRGLWP
jgi:hypothetical protein